MIEETEDEDNVKSASKWKLEVSSPHILEDDSEEEIILVKWKTKHPKKPEVPVEVKEKTGKRIPVTTGRRHRDLLIPVLTQSVAPTEHSSKSKMGELSHEQEVLLMVLNTDLNEIKDGKEQIPALREA